jgi:hypothetical protein
MDKIIPWDEWVTIIQPYYPAGKRGRPPMGIETMLRMYLLQAWFNMSDEMAEDSKSCIYFFNRPSSVIILNCKCGHGCSCLEFGITLS